MKPIAFCIATLFFAVLLQAVSSPGQAVSPTAGAPLKIDAVVGIKNLLVKPELVYPEEARQQHIEGKVELELTVSPQGDVVSERVISGPSALQQATMDAFKKVKYATFLSNLEPSVAFVQAIVTYEKDHVAVATESQHAGGQGKGGGFGLGTGAPGRQVGDFAILSDTQGVDFGPYLQQVVLPHLRKNWSNAIPESAQFKHGNLIIRIRDYERWKSRWHEAGSHFRRHSAGSRRLDRHHGIGPISAVAQRIWRAVCRAALPLLLQPHERRTRTEKTDCICPCS